MKIAYTFSGHSRTWKRCYKSFFDNLYNVLPGDIFMHTWEDVSQTSPSYWNNYRGPKEREAVKKVVREELLDIYKPKQLLIEPQRSILIPPGFTGNRQWDYTVKIAYESRIKVHNMTIQNGPYDRVFALRPDIEWLSPLDIEELQKPEVYCGRHGALLAVGANSDIWNHGTQKDMDVLCNYFYYMEQYYFTNPNRLDFHENAWSCYMKDQGITVLPSNLKFRIPRISGPDTYFPE